MSTSTSTPTVGTRFTKSTSRGWRDENNNRHRHEYVLLCEVVTTSSVGFEWCTIEVLEETGRPDGEFAFTAQKGATAWFGWEAALERGDVAIIAPSIDEDAYANDDAMFGDAEIEPQSTDEAAEALS